MFYFGCYRQAGHYLFDEAMRGVWRDREAKIPFRPSILDGGLLPQSGEEIEGLAYRSVIGGWTVISFWDRSVDARPGCNSSFIAEGDLTSEEMIELAEKSFPNIWARFQFKVTPAFPSPQSNDTGWEKAFDRMPAEERSLVLRISDQLGKRQYFNAIRLIGDLLRECSSGLKQVLNETR